MWILILFTMWIRYTLADNVDVNLICREESKMSYFFKGLDFVCAGGTCTRKDKLCERTAATMEQCVLPPYPQNGNYSTPRTSGLAPGQKVDSVILNYSCDSDYNMTGESVVFCVTGRWSGPTPVCTRMCVLVKELNIKYRCLINGNGPLRNRECAQWEPNGTVVHPECKTMDSFFPTTLSPMRCIGGQWDNVASCVTECGRLPKGADDVPVPWHASIFNKEKDPYQLVAGGSVIAPKAVITAARAFFREDIALHLPKNYVAALGQLRRNWEDLEDNVQKIIVKEIKVSDRYAGAKGLYAKDLTLVLLTTPITFNQFVSPVCLYNDPTFEETQVTIGNAGMIASWKPKGPDGLSPSLTSTYMHVAHSDSCTELTSFIKGNKFCTSTSSMCDIDYGSGLAFPDNENNATKYYLRGFVFITSEPRDPCPRNVGFTRIIYYIPYLKMALRLIYK